ncbi:MAG: hypothetical protein P8107_08070 [Spirochaetia bacterium]
MKIKLLPLFLFLTFFAAHTAHADGRLPGRWHCLNQDVLGFFDFQKNGSGSHTDEWGVETTPFTWKAEKNMLTITWKNGIIQRWDYFITSTGYLILAIMGADGLMVETYERVK